jgi:hopanoid-associated phosphorylase
MIVVVGLAFEARIAAGPGLEVICGGDGGELAESVARAIAADRGRGLLSFGVAGGLAPQLAAGTCIIGSAVFSGDARIPTDERWSARLLETIPGAVHGILAGVPSPVATTAAKRALHEETGAIAVDMESHVVANLAARHGLPFAAIRVVTDPAGRTLPRAALRAMRPDGTTDILAMLRSVLRRPHELAALLRTALDVRMARATLVRGRRLLGPDLGVLTYPALELDAA